MKAWQVSEYGAPEQVLQLADVTLPAPGPGELRLRVLAAGLGLPDVMMCGGGYEFRPDLPFTPGQEVCGEVLAVGEGVSYQPGQRLCGVTAFYNGHGGFAEETLSSQDMLYPVPESMPAVQAAGFSIPFQTAWAALVERGAMQPGETLVVLGAAGGSGAAAVELGHALGARVIAVAAGAERSSACLEYGADVAIDYRAEDVVERVMQVTKGSGADLVFDPVGGAACEQAVDYLAPRGRILMIGFASGKTGHPSGRKLLLANASLLGVFVGAYSPAERQALHASLLTLFESGQIDPRPGAQLTFSEIPSGLAQLAARGSTGKLVALLDS